jgi:hypothetical protein
MLKFWGKGESEDNPRKQSKIYQNLEASSVLLFLETSSEIDKASEQEKHATHLQYGIFKQSMGARNRVPSYRPVRLNRLAELIP